MKDSILNKIDLNDLFSILGHERIQLMKFLINVDEKLFIEKDFIINSIISVYGNDLLLEKKIRILVFDTIDIEILIYLTKKYCKKEHPKRYDNAIELSLLPWKYGSEFVNEVSNILELSDDLLPQLNIQLDTTIELRPIISLPPLHDYQNEVKDKIIFNLNERTKRFLVQMPTGSGKTRTTLQSIIEYVNNTDQNQGKTIVWLAHTEELCEQAFDTISKLWPILSNNSIKVSRLWGNNEPSIENIKGAFVIGTFQKFVALYNGNSFLLDSISKFLNILIIDEAHKSIATSYSKIINFLTQSLNSRLIGITATPGRNSNNNSENQLLSAFFDRNLITPNFISNPILELQEKGILARLKRVVINTKINISFNSNELLSINNEDIPSSTIKKLSLNNSRNKLIIDLIEDQVLLGNPCLIFSCNNEHSKLLNAVLNYKKITSHYLDFKTNSFTRKKIIQDFKDSKFDVLINYGILSTGFDAPRIRSIIVTRPTSSIVLYSQIIGRGLRGPKMGGANECNLFDIKDNYENFGGIEDVYNYFDGYWL
jgi:DNA repair protein RadD